MNKQDVKIMWLSNAIWVCTGYGNQTKLFVPRIRDLGYQIGISTFWGLDGGLLNMDGIPIYPKAHHPYGQDIAAANARHFVNGDGPVILISLMDAWVCSPEAIQKFDVKWVPWFPIDMEPVPPAVLF